MNCQTSLRAQYIAHEITFHDYYGALVEYIGEAKLRGMLPGNRTPAEWAALIDADEHLNNVPLQYWDDMHGLVRMYLRGGDALRAINGTGCWSLSDSVCVLKETARRYSREATS